MQSGCYDDDDVKNRVRDTSSKRLFHDQKYLKEELLEKQFSA